MRERAPKSLHLSHSKNDVAIFKKHIFLFAVSFLSRRNEEEEDEGIGKTVIVASGIQRVAPCYVVRDVGI